MAVAKRDLTRLINSGMDPDEIEDAMEDEAPRLKEPKVPRTRMDIGRKRGPARSPRPWLKGVKDDV